MIFLRNYFVDTTDSLDCISVVHEMMRTIRESGMNDGLITIMIPEPGAGIGIIEPLPDIIQKFKEAAASFPGAGEVTKNRRKDDISILPRVAAAMLGKSASIPLKGQRPVLGAREEPVLLDFTQEGRRREFYIQIMGESEEATKVPQQMRRPGPPQRRT
jgi:thiamine phosphate synthase YjbQ (UPF0047 family)